MIVEVSSTLWQVVDELAFTSACDPCPLMNDMKLHTVGMSLMVTDETIALPPEYFRLWGDDEEHVFDTVEAMVDGILAMYDDAASVMPEQPHQRWRRIRLFNAASRLCDMSHVRVRRPD